MLITYAFFIWLISAIICLINFDDIGDTNAEDITKLPNWITFTVCFMPFFNMYLAYACLKDWYDELRTKYAIWKANRVVNRIKKKHNLK